MKDKHVSVSPETLKKALEGLKLLEADEGMKDRLMNTYQAAQFLKDEGLPVTAATLGNWRRRPGVGPRFKKLGGFVRYEEADLEEFLAGSPREKYKNSLTPSEGFADGKED